MTIASAFDTVDDSILMDVLGWVTVSGSNSR